MGCTDSKEVDERSEQSPGPGQRGTTRTSGAVQYRTPSRASQQDAASGRRSQGSAPRREICPCYLTGYCAAGDACPDLHVELNQINAGNESAGHRSLSSGATPQALHVVAVPRGSVRTSPGGGGGGGIGSTDSPQATQSPPPYPSYYSQGGSAERLGYPPYSSPPVGPDEPVVVFDDDSPEDREERALQAALALSIAQANREEAERQRVRAGVEASSETGLREALRRSALESMQDPLASPSSPQSPETRAPPQATVAGNGAQGAEPRPLPEQSARKKQRSFPPNTSVTRIKRLFPLYRYKSTPQRGTELVQFPSAAESAASPTRVELQRNSTRSDDGLEIEFEGDSEGCGNGAAKGATSSQRDYSNPDSENGGNESFGSGLQVATVPPSVPLAPVGDDGDDCAICFVTFAVGDEVLILPCTHRFHADCVAQWLTKQASCPTCNWSVFDDGRSKLRPH